MLCLICLISAVQGQIYDRWYYGDGEGMLFTYQGIQQDTNSQMQTFEGCATACDYHGNLLFYASPETVWDKTHNVMPNGDSLSGNVSCRHGVLLCHHPTNSQQYYVITLDAFETWPQEAELRYSIVDMSLNGGLGDVVTGSKNVLVADSVYSERMVITSRSGSNSNESWLINLVDSNIVSVYRVHENGIELWSNFAIPDYEGSVNEPMYISEDGSLLAISLGSSFSTGIQINLVLLSFDTEAGILSFATRIKPDYQSGFIAGSFDRSGKYFYTSKTMALGQWGILSYDVSSLDSLTIANSVDTISFPTSYFTMDMKLALNDTIYCLRSVDSSTNFLAGIANPSQENGSALYVHEAAARQLPVGGEIELPSTLRSPILDFVYQDTCYGDSTRFLSRFFGVLDSLKWDFGDGFTSSNLNSSHQFSSPGSYDVKMIIYIGTNTDTVTKSIFIVPVVASISESIVSLCEDSAATIDLVTLGFDSALWHDGSTELIKTFDTPGTYWVTASGPCSEISDTFTIIEKLPPNISLAPQPPLCEEDSLRLSVPYVDDQSYLWSTGSIDTSIVVGSWLSDNLLPVNLWLKVSNSCGADSDSLTISFLPLPVASLPPDSIQCFDDPVPIRRPDQEGTTYSWNDGSDARTVVIEQDTSIWLMATNNCGIRTDTFTITFHPEIQSELGEDTVLCPGQVVHLNAAWEGSSYLWSPVATTDSNITVFAPGEEFSAPTGVISQAEPYVNYVVTVTNGPCQKVEAKAITLLDHCDTIACKFEIPNVFSPNGDGVNDQLIIENSCGERPFKISIYNRWGQLLFEDRSTQRSPKNRDYYNRERSRLSWDGTINGSPASAGTYFIVVQGNYGFTQRNSFTLIK